MCSAINSARTSSLVCTFFSKNLNPFLLLLHLAVGTLLSLKGSRSVLEELLLPAVEHRRPQAQFLTQVRDRNPVQKVAPQNGHLLLCGVMLSFLFIRSLRYLNGRTLSPFPTEAGHWHVAGLKPSCEGTFRSKAARPMRR